MLDTIRGIYNLNRCLVSPDQDKALAWIAKKFGKKNARFIKVRSGAKAFTWTIPDRWELTSGELTDLQTGKTIITTQQNPLHVITGSLAYRGKLSYQELLPHLHFRRDYPEAIPYVMRFYEPKQWGLALSYTAYMKLDRRHKFGVTIETKWSKGNLSILELTIPGKTKNEIHVLAHVDHPFQANDNLSGVAVALEVFKSFLTKKPVHTYKFIFHSETIGTIGYLSERKKELKNIKAAIALDIVGNENTFLFQKTFKETEAINYVMDYVYKMNLQKYRVFKFQEFMGSDELTYNDPTIGIPAVLISTYPYKRYHTQFDTPDIISEKQLKKAALLLGEALEILDSDFVPKRSFLGPLQRGPIGWFLDSMKQNTLLDLFLYYIDDQKSVLEIAGAIGLDLKLALNFASDLRKRGLLS